MADKTREIALSEVKQHATPDDCWVAVNNKVYDVTDFLGIVSMVCIFPVASHADSRERDIGGERGEDREGEGSG